MGRWLSIPHLVSRILHPVSCILYLASCGVGGRPVYSFLAGIVDFFHAAAMVLWVGGIPLLFWRRWPRLTTFYVYYSIIFIIISQISDYWLGECFLTTIARYLRHLGGTAESDRTWFTIRLAEQVFRLRPSEAALRVVTKVLVLIVCVGTLVHMFRTRRIARMSRRYPHGANGERQYEGTMDHRL